MKRMPTILIALAALAAAAPGCARAPVSHSDSDPRAVKVAEDVMSALGGRDRWHALTGLCWSFGATQHDSLRGNPRLHAWNLQTGQERVEGVMRDGSKFVIVHTVGDTTRGAAWVNGTPILGDSLLKLVKRADAMWVNDSYWFLMPYKLLDPGVTLKYAGVVEGATGPCDRIALSFHHVGLTPGDRYWVDVDQKTHRIGRWEMVLEGDQPPPVAYTWEGWEEHDGLWFPTAHRREALDVFTRDVRTLAAFPAAEFARP